MTSRENSRKAGAAFPPPPIGRPWSVVDLCCGIGGLSLAASQLGLKILGGVDLSEAALESYKHNFPTAKPIHSDVSTAAALAECRTVLSSATEGHRTLVVSGPPCQGFSAAGPRVGWDPRNKILMAVARAIVALRPDAAVIENVSALASTKHVRRLARFKKILTDDGFNVIVMPLNAADFGTPQIRHRVIFFVSRAQLDEAALRKILSTHETKAPTVREALARLPVPPVYDPLSKTEPKIANHVAMRHSGKVKRKIAKIKQGSGPMSYRKLAPNRASRTLISGNRAPPAHFSQARSITVREAARLQGFPDEFEIKGTFSKQLLHVTNAVPPPLARAVIATVTAYLESQDER